jgi:hypothetical protein
MYRTLITGCLAVFLATTAAAQHKAKPLDDAALDRITAGGFTQTAGNGSFEASLLNPTTVGFRGTVATSKGPVEAFGTLSTQAEGSVGGINVSGGALQGAQSLITILAANSRVNVLLNLVVLINPTNVTITQSNSNH